MSNSQFKLLLTLQILTLFLVGMFFFTRQTSLASSAQPSQAMEPKQPVIDRVVQVNYDGNYVMGDNSAKNELIVFSGFNCSYCQKFYLEMFGDLRERYLSKGLLKVIFMGNGDTHDIQESLMDRVTELARQKNGYEIIQKEFYSNSSYSDSASIINALQKIGLDPKVAVEGLQKPELKNWMSNQLNERKRLEIHGTPTFVFNGHLMSGYRGRDDFMSYFEKYFVRN